MATWWDDLTSAETWRQEPFSNLGRLAVCTATLGGPCIGGELAESAGEARQQAIQSVGELRSTVREAGSSLLEGGADAAERALRAGSDAAERPLHEISNIMMWVAIGLIAVTVMVAVGALLYFTWPLFGPLVFGA